MSTVVKTTVPVLPFTLITLAPSAAATTAVGVPSKKTRGRPKKTVSVA